MVNGRVESYVHSDHITPGKGGVLVRVTCKSDSAAKTPLFGAFARTVAKMAYASGATDWDGLIAVFPDVESERVSLQNALREPVAVDTIARLSL